MVWVAWNKTAPILPMKGKFVKPIIWVLINEFWFLLGCLHIESWTTTPRDLLPGAILVGQVIQHYLVITKWSVQFQMQLCLSKHPFFMLMRSWMMCNFIFMRIFGCRRWCYFNYRWLLSIWLIIITRIVNEIKHLIEIEPNTKISKRIHEMRVFKSIAFLKKSLN